LIAVEPHADSIEFAAAQPAVVIVVKGRERLETVTPKKLPRVTAEHLPPRRNAPAALRIPHEHARVGAQPGPALLCAKAAQVEFDRNLRREQSIERRGGAH